MKRFLIAIASGVKLIVGLLAVAVMLVGAASAIRKLWERARGKMLDETFLEG